MAQRGTSSDSRSARPDAATEAAADLYGLPLSEFTTARTEWTRRVRSDGDRDAAAAIGRLPKPSVVAWLANQLARQHPDEIQSLLELGEALREATADLDAAALRKLSRQQHQVVSALLGRAREVGAAAGQAVSDSTARGLEDTLHAALADEAAAQQLTQGQLAAGLSRMGFPGIDDDLEAADATAVWAIPPGRSSPSAAPSRTAGPGRQASTGAEATPAKTTPGTKAEPGRLGKEAAQATKAETRKVKAAEARRAKAAEAVARAAEEAAEARRQQLERARQAEAEAQRDVDDAACDRDQAQAALTQAEADGRQAAETVSRIQDELDAALTAQKDAGRAQRRARPEADRAGRTARQADRRLAAATSRREDLERER